MFIKPKNSGPAIKIIGIGGFGSQMIRELEMNSELSSAQLITIVPEETKTETLSQEIVLSTISDSITDYGNNYEAQQLITPENRDLIASKLVSSPPFSIQVF